MNKHLHRVIFNAARGIRMAVQETATSAGKASRASTQTGTASAVAAALPLLLGIQASHAQIIADPTAPGHQRPTVLQSANGTPTVNIQAPSASGVSRNSYRQFDIGDKGAILNNSRTNTTTQLGGWIQGNPWLANGSAKVIVNEVNSAAASRLMGPLEVAGQRADVIIANPGGLIVDGLNFINAAGVTLSTGRPQYSASGAMTGLPVQDGQIHFQGQGMDATQADYARILARAVTLNAGLWAQEAYITTGINTSTDTARTASTTHPATTTPALQFSLDVAHLGGMYAGKIHIVGTEAGLGVRNAGTLTATTGPLTLDANGELRNSGTIATNGAAIDLHLNAQGVDNSGTLASQQDIVLHDGGIGTRNSGTLQATRQLLAHTGQLDNTASAHIAAQRLDITASGLRNDGHLAQTGLQDLAIHSAAIENTGTQAILGAPPAPQPGSADNPPATGTATPPTTGQDGSAVQSATVTTPTAPAALAPGRIQVADSLANTGTLIANGITDIAAAQAFRNSGTANFRRLDSQGTLDNSGGTLAVQTLNGSHTRIDNRAGTLLVADNLHLNTRTLDNSAGTISSAQALTIQAENSIANHGGMLLAQRDIALQADSLTNDAAGRIVSNSASVALDIAEALNNQQGLIATASTAEDAQIRLQARTLDNTQGEITQNGTGPLRIHTTDTLRNAQGAIVSQGSLHLEAGGSLDNQGGHIASNGPLHLRVQNLQTQQGLIQSGASLTIASTTDIDNRQGRIQSQGALALDAQEQLGNMQGQLQAHSTVTLRSASLDNQGGSIAALAGDLDIHAAKTIANIGGHLSTSADMQISARALDNSQGEIAAANRLTVQAQDAITSIAGKLLANRDIQISAGTLDNSQGEISTAGQLEVETQDALTNIAGKLLANGDVAINAQTLDNNQGEVSTGRQLSIQAQDTMTNTTGKLLANGGVQISSGTLDNSKGEISTGGDLTVQAQDAITSIAGKLLANGDVQINARVLDNSQGEIASSKRLAIHTQDAITSIAGKLLANDDVQISTRTFDNTKGEISTGGDLNMQAQGAITSLAGKLLANGGMVISADTLDNSQGEISTGGQLDLQTQGSTINTDGKLLASGNMEINARTLDNSQGEIASSNRLTVKTQDAISNFAGKFLANGDLQINANTLDNSAGEVSTSKDLSVQTDKAIANIAGKLLANGDVQINTGALDNNQGEIAASNRLTVQAQDGIANIAGKLLANNDTHINANTLNNREGEISTTGYLNVQAQGAIINIAGKLLAKENIQISTDTLDNSQGEISTNKHLNLQAQGAITSIDGKLISNGNTEIHAYALDNSHGEIVSGRQLTLETQDTIINIAGKLLAQDDVDIKTSTLDNSQGEISTSQHLNVQTQDAITSIAGKLLAKGDVAIKAHTLNNSQGEIGTGGHLHIQVEDAITNTAGKLLANSDVQINANALENTQGEVATLGTLMVQTESAISNIAGKLLADGDLQIDTAVLDNSKGEVSTSQNLSVQAQKAITNIDGKLLANGEMQINTGTLDNNQGEIATGTHLTVQAQGAVTSMAGKLFANGKAKIRAHSLDNNRGEIASGSHLTIQTQEAITNIAGKFMANGNAQINAETLDNRHGEISTGEYLNVETPGAITNVAGKLLANGNMQIDSETLDNSQGEVAAGSRLTVQTQDAINNTEGKLFASDNIQINTETLDNNQGEISTGGQLNAQAEGSVINTAGKLLANGDIQINTRALDNNQGEIASSNHLTVQAENAIANTAGKLLANGDAQISAQALNNTQGTIGAGGHLGVQTQADTINSAGKLLGNASVQVHSADLVNDQQGAIGSSAGSVSLTTDALHNQTGSIAAQGTATIDSHALDNTQGHIGAASVQIDTHDQQLTNAHGEILATQGNLGVRSGLLDNSLGRIAAAQAASLTAKGIGNDAGQIAANALHLQSQDSADRWNTISNQSGSILATQRLQLDSAALNNTGGTIQTTDAASELRIHSRSGGITNQQSGTTGGIASAGLLDIQADNASIDNRQGGYIGAQGTLYLRGASTDNQGGTIAANGNLHIQSQTASGTGIDNSAGGTIQSTADILLEAAAARIDNTGGSILANGDLHIQSRGQVGNDQGSLQAGRDLRIIDTSVANGAALDTASQTLSNQDGTLHAGRNLSIQNQGASGAGSIQAQGHMQLAFADSYTHQGSLAVNGDLTLTSGADLINQGTIQGGSSVTVSATNIDNQADAQISAAGTTTVQAQGTLTNRGLIDGSTTRIEADAIDNIGTGRIYGDHLSIAADTLDNRAEDTAAATIAARQRLDIGATTVTNQDDASILSLGDMHFGGTIDTQGKASAEAQAIHNHGAKINAAGNLHMAAAAVHNTNAGLEIARHEFVRSEAGEDLVQLPGWQPESASLYREVWDGTFIPYLGGGSQKRNGIPGSTSDGRIYKPAHPDRFLANKPVAYQVIESCTGNPRDGGQRVCTTTYKYEPPGSPRFAQYGIEIPENYRITPPTPSEFGARTIGFNNAIHWPDSASQAAYLAAHADYQKSIAAAIALNKLILAEIKEDNRLLASSREYTIIRNVTNTLYSDRVAATRPGQITAGGDITVTGLLSNVDSTVIAGGSITAGALDNRATVTGTQTWQSDGTAIFYYWRHKGGFSDSQRRRSNGAQAFTYEESTSFALPTTTFVQHQASVGSSSSTSISANANTGVNTGKNPNQASGASSITNSTDPIAGQGGQAASPANGVAGHAGSSPSDASNPSSPGNPASSSSASSSNNPGNPSSTSNPSDFSHRSSSSNPGSASNPNHPGNPGSAGNASGSSNPGNPASPSFPTNDNQPLPAATNPGIQPGIPGIGPLLPSSSLYVIHANSSHKPLVETDPAFTQYKQWLSSDYMLDALQLDPALMQKRLGDGFYEQQLVQQQVGQLTGRRFLGNHASDEAQYQALLQSGVTFAQTYNLRPGIALSAAQMALLTSDIVWLVAQNVTLPDGSVQSVLVPQVYVVPRLGDLNASGTLLSADSITVQSNSAVHNSGTIAGRRAVQIAALDIDNIGGHIVADTVVLDAQRDINVIGGSVSAALALLAQAGNDINVQTTTRSSSGGTAANGYANTVIDQVAALNVTGTENATLALQAGQDITLQAAQIGNSAEDGRTVINAGQNLNLETVNTAKEQRITWDSKNHLFFGSSQEVGTQIDTQGSTLLAAGNDITARATQVQGAADVRLQAEGDIHITTGQASQWLDDAYYIKSSGLLGSSSETWINKVHTTQTQASSIGAETIAISAGNNLTVEGSNVVSDKGTALQAGQNITIAAATDTHSALHFNEERRSGVFSSGGIGFTVGSQMQSTDQKGQQTSAAGSTIGSIEGSVSIQAGQDYRQIGSDVLAPKGDITIAAQDIAITEAEQTHNSEQHTRFKQSGISVSIGSPVISMAQTAQGMAQAASNTSDTRMQALAAGAAALNVYNNSEALQSLANGNPAAGASVSVSIGSSKSRSDSYQSASTSLGSNVQAGGDVKLTATGSKASSILVQGSDITAGNNASLTADNDIRLLASTDTHSDRSSNKSSSGSIGIAISQGGIGITASASQGKGHANSDDTSYNNTHVTAGNVVKIESGNDTQLKGAVVSGKQVVADVGGDLDIHSLQDSSTFDGKQQSSGGSITLSPAGVPTGGSLSAGQSKINSNYLSVTEQSGIQAGDGGFDVQVKGDTTLQGGVIASTQQAVEQGKNQFSTGGELTISDLHNQASYEGKAVGVSISTGEQGGKHGLNGASAGTGQDSGNAQSTTSAGISAMAGNEDVRTGDATGIGQIFARDKVQREIDAQVAITAEFGQQASTAWGEHANKKFVTAVQSGNAEEMSCWGPDGACRAGGHALLGGLGGGAAGAVGAGLSSAIAPELQHALMESGVAPQAAQAITQLIVVGSGSMVAGSAGAAGAANEVTNNFILAAPVIAEGVVLGGATAARACLSSPACVRALQLGGAGLVAKVAAVLTPEELDGVPGFGAGEQPDFGPGHTGNKTPENPIPGGGVTVYPSDDLQQPIHTGGDQTSDPNPGGNIIGTPISAPKELTLIYSSPLTPVPKPMIADNGLTYGSNDKHTPGAPGSNWNAGIEPRNSLDLFNASIPSFARPDDVRFTKDANGNIHRFSNDGNENWHWSGSTGDNNNPLDRKIIPNKNLKQSSSNITTKFK